MSSENLKLFAAHDENGQITAFLDNSGLYDDDIRDRDTIEITPEQHEVLSQAPDDYRVVKGKLVPFEPDAEEILVEQKAFAELNIQGHATRVRSEVAGTDDPAKLAEYVDKALNAQAVIDGTASKALLAEAKLEAKSLSLNNAVTVANVWKEKAETLRTRRAEINVMIRKAIFQIQEANNVDAVAKTTKKFIDDLAEKRGEWGA